MHTIEFMHIIDVHNDKYDKGLWVELKIKTFH